ncbi:glycine cleavage system P-protein-domain-containing protein [Suillus lakei]|nr:glycine cleavage system P-protein-domain-containing protein [Suillus lakei]
MAALRIASTRLRQSAARSISTVLSVRGLATAKPPANLFESLDTFTDRHIGPDDNETEFMLSKLGFDSMESFLAATVPQNIRIAGSTVSNASIPALSETELHASAKRLGKKNEQFKSFIGMGYHNAVVPPVILRNVVSHALSLHQYCVDHVHRSWRTLRGILLTPRTSLRSPRVRRQFSTISSSNGASRSSRVIGELPNNDHPWSWHTCSPTRRRRHSSSTRQSFPRPSRFLKTRAKGFGINLVVGDAADALKHDALRADLACDFTKQVHETGALVIVATDLLALTLLQPPGEWGADIVLGNSARFGVPAGYGGPHGAFFAVTEKLKRKMPGRLIGRSKDTMGNPAYRLALQTREQHIRREKATSNICTSQALLANMAAMYAVYHGPVGLERIAKKVHFLTQILKFAVERLGFRVINASSYFDTLTIDVSKHCANAEVMHAAAALQGLNLRRVDKNTVGVTLDESVGQEDLLSLIRAFHIAASHPEPNLADLPASKEPAFPHHLVRESEFLSHPVFNKHHSETEMLRYIFHLASKDLGLVHAMIPLGSCTMKLNSTSSMIPLTWPEFGGIHPKIIKELEDDLCKITGFHACSVQPNSGAAGEYAGLTVIRAYQDARGEGHRDVCLIPLSAHGTNPASAVMAGLKVVPVKTHADGNLDLEDLKAKAEKHKDNLAVFMITYPSTFGVFEDGVADACKTIHDCGGQVYLDGANLNAQVGLTNPAVCGGDVCHLNLHKTFAIPHGGGGPGVGPICVAEHLAPFLPSHPLVKTGGNAGIDAVSAAPFGSASILLISWAYIKMLGGNGLSESTNIALLNANYMAHRLAGHYSLRFKNKNGRVAHELLIDLAEFDKAAGLKVTDFAKRVQDYGFHPPTCSWPISTCMLIEPTESETLEEIDRFCDAMIQIRKEAEDIITGKQPKDNNLLKNAPHPLSLMVVSDKEWNRMADLSLVVLIHAEEAAYPMPWLREKKFWPTVSRIDDAYGDLNLICDCPSVEELASS